MRNLKIRIEYNFDERAWDVDDGEEIEHVELEEIGTEVSLERFGELYLVSSYVDLRSRKTFYIADNIDEAIKAFKFEIAYSLYHIGLENEIEHEICEKILEKYSFLKDMKDAYQILKENEGQVSLSSLPDIIRKKYPHLDLDLIIIALSALKSKKYVNIMFNNGELFWVVTKKDF